MTPKTKQDAIDIIEARLAARNDFDKSHLCKHGIEREAEMAIDMAGLLGAIETDQQRHYKERLARIIENDNRQWAEQHRRLG